MRQSCSSCLFKMCPFFHQESTPILTTFFDREYDYKVLVVTFNDLTGRYDVSSYFNTSRSNWEYISGEQMWQLIVIPSALRRLLLFLSLGIQVIRELHALTSSLGFVSLIVCNAIERWQWTTTTLIIHLRGLRPSMQYTVVSVIVEWLE